MRNCRINHMGMRNKSRITAGCKVSIEYMSKNWYKSYLLTATAIALLVPTWLMTIGSISITIMRLNNAKTRNPWYSSHPNRWVRTNTWSRFLVIWAKIREYGFHLHNRLKPSQTITHISSWEATPLIAHPTICLTPRIRTKMIAIATITVYST